MIDGESLWPEVAPLLPPTLTEDVRAEADERARRHVSLSWLGGVAAGMLLGLLLGGLLPEDGPADAEASAPLPAAVAKATAKPSRATPPPVAAEDTAEQVAAKDEDAQRHEITERVSRLPGVARALWSTRSTLLVEVDETSSDRFAEICAVLDRYETLRTSRVHLQPPVGSTQRVRFRQCRTY